MLRRVALVAFTLAVAFVVACGHQVTPEPTGSNSNLSGKIVLTFRTNGPLNFSSYTYAVIVDTCGANPPTPYPNVYGTSFNGYSFAFLVGGNSGQAFPVLDQFILTPSQQNSLNPQVVPANPNLESFTPLYENQTNEFQLIFSRAQLDNPLDVAQPCPNITPAPANGTSPTATASATASASASSSPTASPSPNPNATSMPTTAAQVNWYFNFFTLDNTARTVLDSLGNGGATDNTYDAPAIDTQSTNQYPLFKATGGTAPTDPSAQIEGGEIDNYQ